jgi:hypothetical protein
MNTPTPLPVAVRAFTRSPPDDDESGGGQWSPGEPWPANVLVLDTETTTDEAQRLLFGAYRYLRWTDAGTLECREEGLFYADELPDVDPDGYSRLLAYVRKENRESPLDGPELEIRSRREFIRRVFYRVAWEAEALVVGFNLPFDLTRIATYAGEARGIFRGGFSLALSGWRDPDGRWREDKQLPRVRIKHIDSKRSFIGFASPAHHETWDQERRERPFRGNFLDLRTLGFALTNRSYSLKTACVAFDVESGKGEVDEHGAITSDYITYCRQDVVATAGLLQRLRGEFDRHPVDLDPCRTFSPASVAKAYLKEMGLIPPREKFDVPPRMLGHAMGGYYGGRAECRIRRTVVPIVYCDFLSMYPTVNALMGLWKILRAKSLQVVGDTEAVRKLLERVDVEGCFDPALWAELPFFARVAPEDDVLPVRAEYDHATRSHNIGVNRFTSEEPLWYSGPDLVASTLLAGKPPEVLEAFRLVPQGIQGGLREVELGGEIPIDPSDVDFFRRVIEQRKGLGEGELPERERERLDRFLKVLANSGSYGIFAEVNRLERPPSQRDPLEVYGLGDPFEYETDKPEEPGVYCFPPLASLITGGARLMLALLESCVAEKGGTYAFCDTDSMAIVASQEGGVAPCAGGGESLPSGEEGVRVLTWEEVDEIVQRFTGLNPYDPSTVPGSVLEVEDENFEDGEQIELNALAISAKRYVLFRREGEQRDLDVVKYSEHGLGHLIPPTDPSDPSRTWIKGIWTWILGEVEGEDPDLPPWADRPAVTRTTVSSPHLMRPFSAYNEGKSYGEQIKPMNFLLSVQLAPFGQPPGTDPTQFQLISPYEQDRSKWLKQRWTEKYSEAQYHIHTGRGGRVEDAQVRSYGDVLREYARHPEPKSAAPTGYPCERTTDGLLARRHVRPVWTEEVGKESNRLEDVRQGLVHSVSEIRSNFSKDSDSRWKHLRRLMKTVARARLAELAGISERQVTRIQNGHARPNPETAGRIIFALKQELAREAGPASS